METEALHEDLLQHVDPRNAKTAHAWFLAGLGLIAIGSLLIRIYVSAAGMMDFDEWQHVFMAGGARWTDLSFELDTNAHPPLFFLLLRGLLHLGHSKLLYRSISIFSGAISVVLVGLIARRVCRHSTVALLCAGAFGFSAAAISISSQVRSYQLTIAFVLLAFLSYLEMLSEPADRRSVRPYVLFAVATSAAVACHYFAGLFLAACLAVPCLLALISAPYRSRLSPFGNGRALLRLLLSMAVPLCVLSALYLRHARNQPIQGYLYGFYFGFGQIPHETRAGFTLRNLQNLSNLFSPVVFQQRPAFLLTLTLCCAGAVYVLVKSAKGADARRQIERELLRPSGGALDTAPVLGGFLQTRNPKSKVARVTNLPILFVLTMVSELIFLSLKKKYPFGGLMRHQYIVAPFLAVAVFIVLDRLVSLLTPKLRAAILILVAASVALNAAVFWPGLIVGRGLVAYRTQFEHYRAAFPSARAVYLDRFGVIGYFLNTDDEPRHFVRHISDDAFIDQYRIGGGSPEGVQIFYDKTRDNLNLADAGIYRSFAACLRQSATKELTLFFFTAGDVSLGKTSESLQRMIVEAAAHENLSVTKVIVDGTAVYAGFTLKS